MSSSSSKKPALAVAGTAVLAFLLLLPTVLLASGALGQNDPLCQATGYCARVAPVSTGSGVSASGGVGNLGAGQTATLVIGGSDAALLETASVIPESVLQGLLQSQDALVATLHDSTQLRQLASAPAALDALLSDAGARDTILADPAALHAILGSRLGATAALGNDAFHEAIVGRLATDPALAATVVANPAAVGALLPDHAARAALVDQVMTNPAVLDALAHHAPAVGVLLQDDEARRALLSNPVVLDTILAGILGDPHVSSVAITAAHNGTDVRVSVKEYLATDPAQGAIQAGGAGLAHVTLTVSTPDASGATSYAAMKVLDVSSTLGAGGVSQATVTFKVTQAELLALGKTSADVRLLHQVDGQWVPLPTSLVGGPDADGVYTFSAQTPSFSYFAIAAAQPAASTSAGFSGLGLALLILGFLAILAIVFVVVIRRKSE